MLLRRLLVLSLVLSLVACGSSKKKRRGDRDDGGAGGEAGAPPGAGGASGTTGGRAGSAGSSSGASGGTGNEGGEAGTGASGGASGGVGGAAGGSGGSGGSAGTAAAGAAGSEACEGVECSGRGECVESDGAPRCDCDAGYSARGLECVECEQATGSLDIDVPMVVVSGIMRLNDVLLTNREASLRFVNAAGDSLTATNIGEATYTAAIVPGTYDIVYSMPQSLDDGVPDNQFATLLRDVTIDATQTLHVDIPMVTVSGAITVNGEPVSTLGEAFIYFIREAGDLAVAGNVSESAYMTELVPGTYDVVYAGVYEDDAGIPRNMGARLISGLTVDATQTLDLELPFVTISGDFTINGMPAPELSDAEIYLATAENDLVSLGNVVDRSYSVSVVPGTYDVMYSSRTDGDGYPRNGYARVLEGVTIDASGRFDIDVPMVTLSGNVTVNGEPVSTSAQAFLQLFDGSDLANVARLADQTYSAGVIPGTYDVVYFAQTHDQGIPDNQRALVLAGVNVEETGTLDLDVPMVTLSGNVRVNGAFPATTGTAIFYLTSEAGDHVSVADLASESYAAELVPGTYRGFYAAHGLDAAIPSNQAAPLLGPVTISESRTLDLDVPMVSIGGDVTVNGEPAATDGIGVVQFVKDVNDSLDAANLSAGTYTAVLVPGTYDLVYGMRGAGDGLPANQRATLACVQIE